MILSLKVKSVILSVLTLGLLPTGHASEGHSDQLADSMEVEAPRTYLRDKPPFQRSNDFELERKLMSHWDYPGPF